MRQAWSVVPLASGGALATVSPPTDALAPLLFLHGVGGAAWSWAPQAHALSATRPTFVWEARGHGQAARVNDAGLGDYYIDACEGLAYVTRAHGPAWVIGHSMGGLLALALAAERAASVAGLVLIDPVYAPHGGRHAGMFARVARAAVGPLVRSVERDGRIARMLARRVFAAAFRDRAAMSRAWVAQRTQVPVEYPKMMYEAFDGPSGFPNRAFAREVTQPTLLLEPVGARGSRLTELVADVQPLRERFQRVALDGGHYLQLDRTAERVTHEIASFVNRW